MHVAGTDEWTGIAGAVSYSFSRPSLPVKLNKPSCATVITCLSGPHRAVVFGSRLQLHCFACVASCNATRGDAMATIAGLRGRAAI